MTDRADLIAKIRKCLALAKSANEHEAAAALAKAQALMREYGIEPGSVEFEDVAVKGNGAQRRPAAWECDLARTVQRTFGAFLLLDDGEWRFVAPPPSAELAAYAFSVLFRQLRRARRDYMRQQLRRVRPGRKSARADVFCEAWVYAVRCALRDIAPPMPVSTALTAYAERRWKLQTATPRDAGLKLDSAAARNDWINGSEAGRAAELRRPVSGGSPAGLVAAN